MSRHDQQNQQSSEESPQRPPRESYDPAPTAKISAATLVAAGIDACFEVAADIQSYELWVDGLRLVEVLTSDEQDRPLTVRFQAEGLGRKSRYVLAYDFSGAPYELAWTMVEGDLTREISGRYRFHDMTEDLGSPTTEVDYELTIGLAVSLPGFVKRRAEEKILKSAVDVFKERVEGR